MPAPYRLQPNDDRTGLPAGFTGAQSSTQRVLFGEYRPDTVKLRPDRVKCDADRVKWKPDQVEWKADGVKWRPDGR